MEIMTKQFKYTSDFTINTYSADFTRTASPEAILGFMQELATVHAEKLGLGYEDSKKNGFYWVIGRSKYEFSRLPKLFERINVTTWPAGVDGLCALRRFEFRIDGEVIGEGFTYWLMLDCNNFRPVKPQYFFDMTKNLPIQETDHFKLKKESVPIEMNFIFERVMYNSDLDWNNHVNNLKHAELIYDAIPNIELLTQNIVCLQINYLKEIKHNDRVEIYAIKDENNWHVEGRVDGKSMFTAIAKLSNGTTFVA